MVLGCEAMDESRSKFLKLVELAGLGWVGRAGFLGVSKLLVVSKLLSVSKFPIFS